MVPKTLSELVVLSGLDERVHSRLKILLSLGHVGNGLHEARFLVGIQSRLQIFNVLSQVRDILLHGLLFIVNACDVLLDRCRQRPRERVELRQRRTHLLLAARHVGHLRFHSRLGRPDPLAQGVDGRLLAGNGLAQLFRVLRQFRAFLLKLGLLRLQAGQFCLKFGEVFLGGLAFLLEFLPLCVDASQLCLHARQRLLGLRLGLFDAGLFFRQRSQIGFARCQSGARLVQTGLQLLFLRRFGLEAAPAASAVRNRGSIPLVALASRPGRILRAPRAVRKWRTGSVPRRCR